MFRFSLFYAVFLHWGASLFAQCPPATGNPIVIINEVGNFGVNAEYVEILVVGYPGNPYAKVDMRNWILNDNDYSGIDHGNEPGHMRFGECFSAVAPGTLIVIGNEREPTGGSSGSGVINLPGDSPCLLGYEGFPNHQTPAYNTTHPVSPTWLDLVPFRNYGDGAQIRNAQAAPQHAVFWGDCNFAGAVRMPMQGVSAQGEAFLYVGGLGGWNDPSKYISATAGSPGQPNSPENYAFIQSLIVGNLLELGLECEEQKPASSSTAADGEALLTISGGAPGYQLTLRQGTTVVRTLNAPQPGEVPVAGLVPGTYEATVTDQRGCTAVCSFQISYRTAVVIQICAGACVNLGDDLPVGLCYAWGPEDKFTNPHNRTQTICPSIGNTQFGVMGTDVSGQIVLQRLYDFEITQLRVEIEKSPPEVLCPGSTITLTATAGFDSYEWKDEFGNLLGTAQTLTVSLPKTYTVKVRKGTCETTATTTVTAQALPALTISPALPLLCQATVTLTASSGYQEYAWEWEGTTIGVGQSRDVDRLGTYTVTAWLGGCTATATKVVTHQLSTLPVVSPNPAYMCASGGVMLSVQPIFSTYSWDGGP